MYCLEAAFVISLLSFFLSERNGGGVHFNDACLHYTFRQTKPSKLHILLLTLSSLAFMLPWQFAQFVLLTQQLSLLVVYSMTLISLAHFLWMTISLTLALVANVILQFGNTLLLTSFLPPCLIICLVSLSLPQTSSLC